MDATPSLPLLVIIAGPPASGKTTLADRLSEKLRLPLIHRDAITEALADILRPPSRDAMAPITQASFRAFYALIGGHLARGSGVVCETNFQRGVAEAALRPIIAHARTALIHCKVDRALSVRRFIDRAEGGERHWCYFDEERINEIHAGGGTEPWDRADPLDLDVPTLNVDTTDDYDPSLADIVAFVRSSAAVGPSGTLEHAADASRARNPQVCPKLGFVDDPAHHYSHPTHLHRCYAGVSPVRLATQEQRDLCMTDRYVTCPRLAGVPVLSVVPRGEDGDRVEYGATADLPHTLTPSRSATRRSVARIASAIAGLVLGVALAAIALLALFSADGLIQIAEDGLGRLGVNSLLRPPVVSQDPARALTPPEALAFDLGPSTAGIQQPAPGTESAAPAEPTAAPVPTFEPPTPTPVAVSRSATIRAPAGFNGAVLREAPATSARSVRQVSNGTPIEVLEGSATGDGFTWARVRTEDGAAGWIVTTAIVG